MVVAFINLTSCAGSNSSYSAKSHQSDQRVACLPLWYLFVVRGLHVGGMCVRGMYDYIESDLPSLFLLSLYYMNK